MKNAIAFVFLALVLTACGRRDAEIQRAVTGRWVVQFGGNIRCTNVIGPDGAYDGTVIGFTNGSVIRIQGTILAKDGELIETITHDTDPNEKVPLVVHGKIILLDEHQMVTQWNASQAMTTVAQRVE